MEFWTQVQEPLGIGECWEWIGAKDRLGYGLYNLSRRRLIVHRMSYQTLIGPIPESKVIDHLCRNRACVNPYHLEAVTQRENVLRGDGPSAKYAQRTVCFRGHSYTPENTRFNGGSRICRKCDVIRQRRSRDRRANLP